MYTFLSRRKKNVEYEEALLQENPEAAAATAHA
jgi:hypothetical protein